MFAGTDSTPHSNIALSGILDLLVIGLGPAGVSAAIQAHRDGWRVLAVADEPVGGLVRAARRIRNLPGLPEISGLELAERMASQLSALGVAQVTGRVCALARAEDGFLARLTGGDALTARAVCLATGTRARAWDLLPEPASERVHRDLRSLPSGLEGQQVAVVGGGEAALDTALSVLDRGGNPVLLARGGFLRAAPGLVQEARAAGIALCLGVTLGKIRQPSGQLALCCADGQELLVDHLVVCIGREPRRELGEQHGRGQTPAGLDQALAPGVFWAGDVIRGRDRYVAAALGDGQTAALLAGRYLEENRS